MTASDNASAGGLHTTGLGLNEAAPDSHPATPTSTMAEASMDAGAGAKPRLFGLPEPTVLTLKDLTDLPGQILPEETVYHLRNAAREAGLMVYSLWRNINKAASAGQGEKVRKHIEVE